jgi:hypothetical protein
MAGAVARGGGIDGGVILFRLHLIIVLILEGWRRSARPL